MCVKYTLNWHLHSPQAKRWKRHLPSSIQRERNPGPGPWKEELLLKGGNLDQDWGALCARAPFNSTGFLSSPTAHRPNWLLVEILWDFSVKQTQVQAGGPSRWRSAHVSSQRWTHECVLELASGVCVILRNGTESVEDFFCGRLYDWLLKDEDLIDIPECLIPWQRSRVFLCQQVNHRRSCAFTLWGIFMCLNPGSNCSFCCPSRRGEKNNFSQDRCCYSAHRE